MLRGTREHNAARHCAEVHSSVTEEFGHEALMALAIKVQFGSIVSPANCVAALWRLTLVHR